MDHKRIKNGPKMDQKQIKNGLKKPKMDQKEQKWTKNESKTD